MRNVDEEIESKYAWVGEGEGFKDERIFPQKFRIHFASRELSVKLR